MPGALQGIDHFGRHIGFIVLGQHAGRTEGTLLQLAFDHHALAFAEEIGHVAFIGDRQGRVAVGDFEIERHAVGFFLHAAVLDEATDANIAPVGNMLGGNVRRAVEKDEIVAERRQHQRRRRAEQSESAEHDVKPLALAGHRRRFSAASRSRRRLR